MNIKKIEKSIDGFAGQRNSSSSIGQRRITPYSVDSTSFTGAGSTATNATKGLGEFLRELMPKKIQYMLNIHEGMGEVQNQLINAIGTGMVAPVFIKYNPLSETDKDTRTYTAWRQPVSAVLAVCTQAAIVIPFNSLIKKLADVGYLGTRYNSTLFPSDTYVKNLILKEDPSKKNLSKKEMKAEIKAYNKKHFETALKEMIEKDQIVFNTTDLAGNKSTNKMSDKEFKSLFIETIDDIIKSEENEIEKAFNNKLPKKLARANFYHRHPQESLDVLNKLKQALEELSETIPDTGTGEIKNANANKQFNKKCKEIIKELKKDPNNKDIRKTLIQIVKDIKDKNIMSDAESLNLLKNKVDTMIGSVGKVRNKNEQQIFDYVSEVIKKRTKAIGEALDVLKEIKEKLVTNDCTVQQAQEIIDNAISESEQATKNKPDIDKIESKATRLKSKIKSVSGCIAEKLKKHVKSNIDGYKRWTGLTVSLAILPVTCWLLNRIYPWFMDKAFPELSNKASRSKENKNKKAEVK